MASPGLKPRGGGGAPPSEKPSLGAFGASAVCDGGASVSSISLVSQAARHHGWIAIDQFKISQPFNQTCYNDKLHLNEAGETYLNEVLLRTLTKAEAHRDPDPLS